MKIVCISDTHNCNGQIAVPDGDLLIHSGDATVQGTLGEVQAFLDWYASLPHRRKIFVAGNHDWLYETQPGLAEEMTRDRGIDYLRDSSIEIDGVRFYGSPWQPRFFEWAFNLDRGPEMAEKWERIPDGTEVLITHGPPFGILDLVNRPRRDNAGCEDLLRRVGELAATGLRYHIFGHIHFGYGTLRQNGVTFVNASVCDEDYVPTQAPIVIEI